MVLNVYKATAGFPKMELYGLTSQMRRAGMSVPTNIAEGCGRGGEAELARFMTIAQGSASEIAYLTILATELNYLPQNMAHELTHQVDEVNRMLTAYITKLKAKG